MWTSPASLQVADAPVTVSPGGGAASQGAPGASEEAAGAAATPTPVTPREAPSHELRPSRTATALLVEQPVLGREGLFCVQQAPYLPACSRGAGGSRTALSQEESRERIALWLVVALPLRSLSLSARVPGGQAPCWPLLLAVDSCLPKEDGPDAG